MSLCRGVIRQEAKKQGDQLLGIVSLPVPRPVLHFLLHESLKPCQKLDCPCQFTRDRIPKWTKKDEAILYVPTLR